MGLEVFPLRPLEWGPTPNRDTQQVVDHRMSPSPESSISHGLYWNQETQFKSKTHRRVWTETHRPRPLQGGPTPLIHSLNTSYCNFQIKLVKSNRGWVKQQLQHQAAEPVNNPKQEKKDHQWWWSTSRHPTPYSSCCGHITGTGWTCPHPKFGS